MKIGSDILIQIETAGFHQAHDRGGGDQLGNRSEPVIMIRRSRDRLFLIRIPETALIDNLTVFGNHDFAAAGLETFELAVYRFIQGGDGIHFRIFRCRTERKEECEGEKESKQAAEHTVNTSSRRIMD